MALTSFKPVIGFKNLLPKLGCSG